MLPTVSGTPQVGQTLTATNGTWTNSPTSFTYQWNSAGTPIGGATSSTYVPVFADVGNTLTISVTGTNGSGSSTPGTSSATSSVIDNIPANLALPMISGTAQMGQTLTAATGTWTHNPTSFTYQWNRAGTAIGGATASTYVPVAADVGNTLTVSAVAANSGGSSSPATSSATSSVIDIIPANLVLPTISGTAQVGQTLTATLGTWSHSPTSFVYQWVNTHGLILGATQPTYVPTSADVGLILGFFVVATNSGGTSAAANSAPTAAVIDIIPANTVAPTISGTPQVGQTLTATTGTWSHNPTSFTYQWNRAGGAIPGATVPTYVPVTGDIGNTLTVSVVATNSGGSSSAATSWATSVVIAAAAVPSLFPTATLFNAKLSGTPNIGWTGWQGRQVIAASNLANPGFTSGLIQVTFDLAAGSPGGTLTGADVGNLGTSNAVSFDGGQVPLTFGGSTTITGLEPGTFNSDLVPFTLKLSAGLVISSLWGAGTTNAATSTGSTGNTSSFTNTISDQTATTPASYPASWFVKANTCIFTSNITFSAAPFITGVARAGQTLTASHGAWTNSPTSYAYQWNRAGTAIGGATASTYVPVTGDIGNTLTVSVVATNSGGSSSAATSAATGAIVAASGDALSISLHIAANSLPIAA